MAFHLTPGPFSKHQLLRKERFFASDLSCVRTTLRKILQRLLFLLPSSKASLGDPAFQMKVVGGVLPLPQSLLPDVTLEMAAFGYDFKRGFFFIFLIITFPVAWTARIHSPVTSSPGGGGRQATITVQIQGCWPVGTHSRIVRWGHCSFPWGSCSRDPGRSGAWAWGTGSRWALCSG